MSTTDNDPAVVVKYYLDTVLKLQGKFILMPLWIFYCIGS